MEYIEHFPRMDDVIVPVFKSDAEYVDRLRQQMPLVEKTMSDTGAEHSAHNRIYEQFVNPFGREFFVFEQFRNYDQSQINAQSPHQPVPSDRYRANAENFGIYIPC